MVARLDDYDVAAGIGVFVAEARPVAIAAEFIEARVGVVRRGQVSFDMRFIFAAPAGTRKFPLGDNGDDCRIEKLHVDLRQMQKRRNERFEIFFLEKGGTLTVRSAS